jgi:hypothetical protein
VFRLHRNAAAPTCGRACVTCRRLRAVVPVAVRAHGIGAVDVAALAEASGLPEATVRVHLADDVLGALGGAYLESARGLQRGLHAAYRVAATPREGAESSVRWLLDTLADDPDRARFTYVDITEGAEPLLLLREQIRRSSAGLWELQYQTSHPRAWLPRSHFETISNAAIAIIGDHVRRDLTDRLPDHFDTVMTLFESGTRASLASAGG